MDFVLLGAESINFVMCHSAAIAVLDASFYRLGLKTDRQPRMMSLALLSETIPYSYCVMSEASG